MEKWRARIRCWCALTNESSAQWQKRETNCLERSHYFLQWALRRSELSLNNFLRDTRLGLALRASLTRECIAAQPPPIAVAHTHIHARSFIQTSSCHSNSAREMRDPIQERDLHNSTHARSSLPSRPISLYAECFLICSTSAHRIHSTQIYFFKSSIYNIYLFKTLNESLM